MPHDRRMDQAKEQPASSLAPPSGLHFVNELRLVGFLLLMALGLRIWHYSTTEVPSRDTVYYIRMAWNIANGRGIEAIRGAEQHPGYPLVVCAVDGMVGPLITGSQAERYQRSAQISSILASLLLVPVAYCLSRQMFSPWGAFVGVVFLQILPATGRLFADGLTEPLFLLLVMSTVLLGYVALRGSVWWHFALCGLMGGMAYLVRPEGALFPVCVGLILVFRRISQGTGPWFPQAAALAISFLVLAAPFVAVVGKLTSKPTANRVLTADQVVAPLPSGTPLLGSWFTSSSHGMGREAWAFWIFFGMLARGTLFVLWLPAFLTLVFCRNAIWSQPGTWALALACTLLEFLLQRVAATMGYLSDRHMVIVIAMAAIMAGGGLIVFAERFSGWRRLVLACLLVIPVSAVGLYRTAEPLHTNRDGFRQAGLWLAGNVPIGDEVQDPFCWTHFYAGRIFLESETRGLPISHPMRKFVVVDRSASKHERLPIIPEETLKKQGGKPVFIYESKKRKSGEAVVVYEVPVKS